jgi:cell division protein FtsI (penicillin-binding protein 3)
MNASTRQASSRWRLWLVGSVLGLLVITVCGRLVWLHVLETQHLRDISDEITIRYQKIPAYRGMIIDRFAQPLAISTPVAAIAVRPNKLTDPFWPEKLAPLMDSDAEKLRNRVARSPSPFIYLSRYATPERASQIEALELEGIEVVRQFRRFYPAGEVAAHLVGFTNIEDQGQEGLELSYNDWLSGQDGLRHILRNRRANVVRYVSAGQEVQQGRDLRLSIDLRLQYLTYRALKEAVARARAAGGSAVLVDAWTGEVLALAAQPAFNPNDMATRTPERVRNRPVTDLMEPGSPIKSFTIATALDLGLVEPDTLIETSPGRLKVQGHVIADMRNYGEIDVNTVIAKSSNVGTTKIAMMMEPSALRDRLTLLGLGQPTAAGFPGEEEGFLPSYATWRDLDRAALSYGYSLNITTIQLAQAYSVFANGGSLQPLTLLAEGVTPRPTRIFKEDTVRKMLPMLRAATEEGGTARRAQIPMYHVGGKTGTTMKYADGSYASRQYISSFVGLAPIANPRFVMAISVDDPRSQQYYGGQVAAPVFADVMDDVMRIYDIPPDKLDQSMLAGRAN